MSTAPPATPIPPPGLPASARSPLGGAGAPKSGPPRLASLPPPPELHELDGGWGESDEAEPQARPAGAAPHPEAVIAGPSPSQRSPGPPSVPQVTSREGVALEAEFAALCAAAEAANARAAELEGELARRVTELAEAERTIAELRLAVANGTAALDQAVAVARAEPVTALAVAERTIAGLREELVAARAAASAPGPRVGADDLQAVKGIGPKLAAKLVALGITSFRQLAELGPDDLAPLAELVGVPLKRIERDGWVESARELVAQRSASGSSPPPGDGDVAAGTP